MSGAEKIARLIVEMMAVRDEGRLKRGGDDFISGLVQAYALVEGIDDVSDAYHHAVRRVMEGGGT